MLCMKCGKETKGEQVFCDRCLEIMDSYPVKPDVHIQLPNRSASPQKKARHKQRPLTPEEQIVCWQRKVRHRNVALLFLTLALMVALAALLYTNREMVESQLGTNYTYAEQIN